MFLRIEHMPTLYIHKTNYVIMSKTEDSQIKKNCGECSASFLTQEGLEIHFQRQHGNHCETCPIDLAVKKIKNIFNHDKY